MPAIRRLRSRRAREDPVFNGRPIRQPASGACKAGIRLQKSGASGYDARRERQSDFGPLRDMKMHSGIMWRYLAQETDVLGRLMQSGQTDAYAKANGARLKAIYFVAHGSSFNAAVGTAGFFVKKRGSGPMPARRAISAAEVLPLRWRTGGHARGRDQPDGDERGRDRRAEVRACAGDTNPCDHGSCRNAGCKGSGRRAFLLSGAEESNAKTRGTAPRCCS